MNKAFLKKNVGVHVQLRPAALDSRGQPLDADWQIVEVQDDRLRLQMIGYDYVATLGTDHIYSFLSNPARRIGGVRHGFLQLLVQLTVAGQSVHIDPVPPPKAPGFDAVAHARRFDPLRVSVGGVERYFSWRGRDPLHLIDDEGPSRQLGEAELPLAEAIRSRTAMAPRLSDRGRLRGDPVYELSPDFRSKWQLTGGGPRGAGGMVLVVVAKKR